MNSFLELVQKRQSDRAYLQRDIETDKLDRILEAGRLAPSACNGQPWKMIVIRDEKIRNEVAATTSDIIVSSNHFTRQAPVQIVIVEESSNLSSKAGSWAKSKHFPHFDLGILAAHLCLAAADEGLGSCIVGWFDEKKLRKVLEIPQNKRPVLIIVVGYSAQKTRQKIRKEKSQVISENKY